MFVLMTIISENKWYKKKRYTTNFKVIVKIAQMNEIVK